MPRRDFRWVKSPPTDSVAEVRIHACARSVSLAPNIAPTDKGVACSSSELSVVSSQRTRGFLGIVVALPADKSGLNRLRALETVLQIGIAFGLALQQFRHLIQTGSQCAQGSRPFVVARQFRERRFDGILRKHQTQVARDLGQLFSGAAQSRKVARLL